jgi:putative DNA primase/helicase
MTGGDRITARFMRQDFFQYDPQFKLLIVGNHQPVLRNVDEATLRRFNIIPFIHKPEKKIDDLDKIIIREELPAVFRWAINGCLDWQAYGLLRPASVVAATAEYFESQDLFGRWLEECCERGPKLWTETKALYQSWAAYAKQNGEEPGDVRKLGQMLSKAGFISTRDKHSRKYKGIKLRRDEEYQDAYDR